MYNFVDVSCYICLETLRIITQTLQGKYQQLFTVFQFQLCCNAIIYQT